METKIKKTYRPIISALTLTLATTLAYLPSRNYPFQFDDMANIVEHQRIKILSFSDLCFNYSRWLCTWLNSVLFRTVGAKPILYRVLNIGYHIATGLILFFLLQALLSNLKTKNFFKDNAYYISLLTSTLFLLHPVQTQTVSYITQGQLEGLTALLSLLAIGCFYFFNKQKKQFYKFAAAGGVVLCATTAANIKEIAIVVPFLILLTDWFFISCGDIKKVLKNIWLHLATTFSTLGVYIVLLKPTFFLNIISGNHIAHSGIGNILKSGAGEKISALPFFLSQFKVMLHYLWIFIWPFNICVEYDWMIVNGLSDANCFIPLIGIITIFIGIAYLLKKDPTNPIAFAALWFFCCILPRASIIPSSELLVDYKTYLASAGWLFIIACFVIWFIQKFTTNKQNLIWMSAMIATFLGTATYQRNKIWSSGIDFWKDVICKAPKKARGFNNFGIELFGQGEYQKSTYYFKKAISLNEGVGIKTFYWDAYKNLANAYAMTGNVDGAIEILYKGLQFKPNSADINNNLGALLLHQGNINDAEFYCRKALSIESTMGNAMYNMAKIFIQKSQPAQAHVYLKKGLKETHLDRSKEPLQMFAKLSIELEIIDDAIYALQKILKIDPNHIESLVNLGGIYYFAKDNTKAIKYLEKALRLDPNNQQIQDNLNTLYKQV